jgi:hypothetical protein
MANEAYRNQSWGQRFGTLGDPAENVYLQTRPLGATTEWGFHRPNGIAVSKLPPNLAHTPDFITATHGVEVVGLGRDGILKGIKVEKWEGLKVWQKLSKILGLSGGIMFFVWNSAVKEYVVVPFAAMSKLVKRSVVEFGIQEFPIDSVQYYPIPYEWLRPVAVWVGEHDA